MFYFAYGSNLNHHQMKKMRCPGTIFIENTFLNDFQLSFCHPKKDNFFGYANVHKKKGVKVPGAIWKITKKHEKILDLYEEFPKSYKKKLFLFKWKKNYVLYYA